MLGLKVWGAQSRGQGEDKRETGVNNMALGKCLLLRHFRMFNFRQGV